MEDYELSEHAQTMLVEREIQETWISLALLNPDKIEPHQDGTVHYIKAIEDFGNRYLRVVTNPLVTPKRIVTLFFDRRIRI